MRLQKVGLGLVLALASGLAACRPESPMPSPLGPLAPIALADHWQGAVLAGSEVPADLPAPLAWSFGEPRPEWQPVVPLLPGGRPATLTPAAGALRISLGEEMRRRRQIRGGIWTTLPAGFNRHDWAYAVVEARSAPSVTSVALAANLRRLRPAAGSTVYEMHPFVTRGDSAAVIGDGQVHRYLLRADWGEDGEAAWRELGLMLEAGDPGDFELLSLTLVPKEASYVEAKVGVASELRGGIYHRALYVHTPGRLTWRVEVPRGGRLDFALGLVRGEAPVTFRVSVRAGGDQEETLFTETYADPDRWGRRSLDLSRLAGRTVELALAAEAPNRPGSVALWGAPVLSGGGGERVSRRPNVILYVIDAGGALYTSAYGAHRRTTPNLERLAARGALFENAYSNASWTKPSTASFMTSLPHGVLGGFENPSDPLPGGALTMAERLHGAGYQTGVFTSNTWCGAMSGFDRGVDVLRETIEEPNSVSSRVLAREFFRWRDAWPGRPYWVHFQTTDVHWPWQPVPPVAGTFLGAREWEELFEMERTLGEASGSLGRAWGLRAPPQAFTNAGIDRKLYFERARAAFDEAYAHNDDQLGRLVAELEARGELDDTILIVTADHGDWPALGAFEEFAGPARIPFFQPYLTRVPLVIVWPGHIAPGKRFTEPVSLLDLLPTVLALAGEPVPKDLYGQSLAPLLLDKPGYEPRPVLLEEVNVDPRTKRVSGAVEIVDGRWGASLALGDPQEGEPGPRLLLYDLWEDPYCLKSVHAERPELAKKYQGRLESRFRAHLAASKKYRRAEAGGLRSEQLETLRSLGYLGGGR